MPKELTLPSCFKNAGWKVKIREKERLEPPHVSVICGTRTWRLCLRDGKFRDSRPDPRDVPAELIHFIMYGTRPDGFCSNWEWLGEQWDTKYPDNKIASDG
jgi:hypothetical protein